MRFYYAYAYRCNFLRRHSLVRHAADSISNRRPIYLLRSGDAEMILLWIGLIVCIVTPWSAVPDLSFAISVLLLFVGVGDCEYARKTKTK